MLHSQGRKARRKQVNRQGLAEHDLRAGGRQRATRKREQGGKWRKDDDELGSPGISRFLAQGHLSRLVNDALRKSYPPTPSSFKK